MKRMFLTRRVRQKLKHAIDVGKKICTAKDIQCSSSLWFLVFHYQSDKLKIGCSEPKILSWKCNCVALQPYVSIQFFIYIVSSIHLIRLSSCCLVFYMTITQLADIKWKMLRRCCSAGTADVINLEDVEYTWLQVQRVSNVRSWNSQVSKPRDRHTDVCYPHNREVQKKSF